MPRDAETVDRVVASIGTVAITQSDVLQEYRFETFVADGRVTMDPPPASLFRTIESKLIDQNLLEEQLRDYPADADTLRQKAAEEVNGLRKRFKTIREFHAALHSLGMTEAELLTRLETQQHILMMVDEHTRPAAAVQPEEVLQYYRKTLLPQLARSTKPPPLSQVQDQIREILVQKKMSQLLGEWLAELRNEHHVEFQ